MLVAPVVLLRRQTPVNPVENVQSRVFLAKMMLVMKSNMYMEGIVLLKRTLSP